MPVHTQFFAGEWCDVDYSPAENGFVFARLERPGTLWLHRPADLTRPAQGYALGRWALYLRAAADGAGNVCCVLQDGRDRNPATGQFWPAVVVLFPWDGSPPREIACPAGPAFGQNAVEVISFAQGWLIFVCMSPSRVWRGTLNRDGTWGLIDAFDWAPTSQGLADGDQRMDDVRASVPGMVCPSTADGLSIGQNTDGADRIRGFYAGSYFTVIPGAAFEPHLASDGNGHWVAAARTPQGAALAVLAPPFEPEQPAPEPPTPTPDTPFTVDPTGVIDDLAEWLFAPNQGPDVHLSPDGRVRYFCKSDEGSGDGPFQIGEWWDRDALDIGHLEDSSAGQRVLNGKAVTPETLPSGLTPAQRAALWASLPLNRNCFDDGARLWAPRRCVTGTRIAYTTNIRWTTGYVQPHIPIEIVVDVGHGIINGKPVRARIVYRSFDGHRWNSEVNYYGQPQGYNAWIAGPFPDNEPRWLT